MLATRDRGTVRLSDKVRRAVVATAVGRPAAARAALFAVALVTGVAALASTAPLIVAASGACLVLVILLLWRGDDPPILLLPALFQWSEVAIVPLSTVWKQVPLAELSPYGADLELSALYGLAGVTALAVGLRIGPRRPRRTSFGMRLRAETMEWRFRDVAIVSFAAIAAGYAFAAVSGFAGPARELFHQAANVKYAGLFILAYWCLVRATHYRVLGAVVVFEIVFGMTGFFAEFKDSFLTLLVAGLAARPRVRPSDIVIVGGVGALLMAVAIFWSAVKADYRVLLNQGSGAQEVTTSLDERLDYLMNAASSMDGARFADGFDRLVLRHGYIEFLGLTMAYVPEALPHENGQLTLAVLSHITMPRILFPDKPPLPSDTEVMAKYTGMPMTWNEHTSISIGHLGELYIDFGFVGGLIGMGVIGWLVGFTYGKLRDHGASSALITAGLCLMVALPIAYFGTAYAKLVGGFIFSSTIALAIQRFALPIVLRMLLGHAARPRI
jgi:hypothetical protein